jgi:FkbM family methyltransferase
VSDSAARSSLSNHPRANEETERDLFVVNGSQTGCNSLRPPDVMSGTSPIRVHVIRLDDWLDRQKIDRVHFIKLDVEGGELDVLKGAKRLLERRPRPVILAEVQDVRTRPWGYRANEIIKHLSEKGFRWFSLSENGALQDMDENLDELEGNFVAWPEEVELTLREVQAGSNVRRGGNEPANQS